MSPQAEGVEVEDEALAVIANAAEGSARDGLSILDQAIAHGEGKVTADQVRDMLGLADRGRIRRLLEDAAVRRRRRRRSAQLDEAHALGHRPGVAAARADGSRSTRVTRAKAGAGPTLLQSAEEREAGAELPRGSAGAVSTACGRCCSRA